MKHSFGVDQPYFGVGVYGILAVTSKGHNKPPY